MIHENGFQFLDGTCNGSSTSTSSSVPCVKCCEGNGDFFRLENTQLAGYCPGCFARVVRQKFASCLGRNRVFKKPSQRNTLLLYLPDQLGSDQLLQFVQQTSSEPDVHRRLRIKATVLLLVEELCPQNFAAYFSHCRDLAQQFPSDWQWHFSHVAKIFNSGSDLAITLDCNGFDEQMILNWQGQDLSKLEQLLASCRSGSVRAELSRLLRNQLVTRFALHSKCPTVLLPENADQLAENALNMLCFGRGSSISDLSAVVDTRLADDQAQEQNIGIQFVRPLRDISTRELEAMRRMDEKQQRPNVVNAAAAVHTVTDDGNGSDVQQLTGQFIASLRDSGFPATVSTILSVASKVESERSGIRCALCFAFFQLQSADTPSDAANGQTLPSFCPPLCQPCANLMQEISEHGRSLLAQICCDTLSCLTSS